MSHSAAQLPSDGSIPQSAGTVVDCGSAVDVRDGHRLLLLPQVPHLNLPVPCALTDTAKMLAAATGLARDGLDLLHTTVAALCQRVAAPLRLFGAASPSP